AASAPRTAWRVINKQATPIDNVNHTTMTLRVFLSCIIESCIIQLCGPKVRQFKRKHNVLDADPPEAILLQSAHSPTIH
ncbi:MAG: hypothetical protein MK364_03360, partial [Pirellulales bacterium]|nr:hypothetical protein [Pirellulales bacterium]